MGLTSSLLVYALDQSVSLSSRSEHTFDDFTYHHSFLFSWLLSSFQIDYLLRWNQLLWRASTSSSQPNGGSIKCVLSFVHGFVPSS